jgi:hypothetical protein
MRMEHGVGAWATHGKAGIYLVHATWFSLGSRLRREADVQPNPYETIFFGTKLDEVLRQGSA